LRRLRGIVLLAAFMMWLAPPLIAAYRGGGDYKAVLRALGPFGLFYYPLMLVLFIYGYYLLTRSLFFFKFLFLALAIVLIFGIGLPLLAGLGPTSDLSGVSLTLSLVGAAIIILYARIMDQKRARVVPATPEPDAPERVAGWLLKRLRRLLRVPTAKPQESLGPPDAEYFFRLAAHAEKAGDLAAAARLCREAAEVDPIGPWGAKAREKLANLQRHAE